MAVPAQGGLTVAIFASDKGPGDPERASLMGEAGRIFARKGGKILCLAEDGVIPVPLITAARAAGGQVEILADTTIVLPPALAGVTMTVIEDRAERLAVVGRQASAIIGLPGSIASAAAMFSAWAQTPHLPVLMLNRHRAFEAIRGFAVDVLAVSVPGHDRRIGFADTVEDLWNRAMAASQPPR